MTVFYDGKCIVCFKEISHYKKLDKHKLLRTIDISASDFEASDYGLDSKQVNLNIHSIDARGNVFTGVGTFSEIWKRIDPYSKLAFILENQKLKPLFNIGYKTFAHYIRPNLPKRKCNNESCEIMV
ncbi:MAG: DCC1-like thiol-disulfide oxidoreductase family protein [Halobacteriovoraceae bacterium]|nr:DCC1-like thiol-disulfide oxidoreductase family protein [Halobacteriovoraceae bacterium]